MLEPFLRRPVPLMVLIFALGGGLAERGAQAAGPTALLADLAAAPALRQEAAVVSLLIRSLLGPAERTPTTRRELVLALEAIGATAAREDLSLEPALVPQLVQKLGVDRIFVGALNAEGRHWVVEGQVLGPDGKRLARIVALGAPGDVSILARQVARRLAYRMGLAFALGPEVSVGQLRPFAKASMALLANDATQAARALGFADRTLAPRLSAVREVADAIWLNDTVPAELRMRTALVAGNNASAAALADGVLKDHPDSAFARATKVRALTVLKNFRDAEGEWKKISAPGTPDELHGWLAIADNGLQAAQLKPKDVDDGQMIAAVADKDFDDGARDVLGYMAPADPHTFGYELEVAALKAAQRIAARDPGLASAIATRALWGGTGVDVRAALPLVLIPDLTGSQLATVKARADGAALGSSPDGLRIAKALQQRIDIIKEMRLGGLSPSIPNPEPLVAELRDLLARFDGLVAGGFSRALILGRTDSGQMFLWPLAVKPYRLHDGLLMTLVDAPYELTVARPPAGGDTIDESGATEGRLADLADETGADVVIVHHVRPWGLSAAVDLLLVDPATRKSFTAQATMGGGLAGPNGAPLATAGVLLVVLAITLVMRRMRGHIVVRLQSESEVSERFLSLSISRSPVSPVVSDIATHVTEVKKIGPRKTELGATLIGHLTEFPKVPTGTWYVHLYGVYRRGRAQRIAAGDTFTQMVVVKRRKTLFVDFSLAAVNAEFLVTVVDDKLAVAGSRIWLDDDDAHPVVTGKNGSAVIDVPRGKHVIHISAKGMHIERPFEVVKLKTHELPINLVWERRVEDVSRALEQSEEYKAARRVGAEEVEEVEEVSEVVAEVEAELPESETLVAEAEELPADGDAR